MYCAGVESRKITDANIDENCKIIGIAFNGCNSLESVTIPDSVKTIKSSAIMMCDSLNKIIFSGTKEEWKSVIKEGNWIRDVNNISSYVECNDGQMHI